MVRSSLIAACLLIATITGTQSQSQRSATEVDLQLVLAVDISYSMDPEEQRLQREGYMEAIVSPEVIEAIGRGLLGRIAVSYLEWAGSTDQQVVVGWRMIDGKAAAEAFAAELRAKPYRRAFRTSVSGALDASTALIETSGLTSQRRVIDVSGDGANNNGRPVEPARDDALSKRITINGLPIMLKRPDNRTMDIANLDQYYEDCVVGGPGSFVIPIKSLDEFVPATRRKLIMEIAGLDPVRLPYDQVNAIPVDRVKTDCLIGERL